MPIVRVRVGRRTFRTAWKTNVCEDEMVVAFTACIQGGRYARPFQWRARRSYHPRRVAVDEQLQHATNYEAWKASGNKDGAPRDPSELHGYKRTSILFTLPY
jgi:hypothetical protein